MSTKALNRAEQLVQFDSIKNCALWIATLSPLEISIHPPLSRLSEALRCLQAPLGRQKRSDIQRIAKNWGVLQFSRNGRFGKKNMAAHEVEKELETKVLREATRLRKLQFRVSNGACLSSWSALREAFLAS